MQLINYALKWTDSADVRRRSATDTIDTRINYIHISAICGQLTYDCYTTQLAIASLSSTRDGGEGKKKLDATVGQYVDL